jgi:hypothetical protein
VPAIQKKEVWTQGIKMQENNPHSGEYKKGQVSALEVGKGE